MTVNDRPTGDILVVGALVADGSGAPLAPLDVLVRDGQIAALYPRVGTTASTADASAHRAPAATVIDAHGLVLAPGFIDVHSHADASPFLRDDDTTKILQGVTTEVVGNCGATLAPLEPGREALSTATAGRLFPEVPSSWHSFAEMLEQLDARGYVTNYCPLVGHGALRIAALGAADRLVTPAELAHMQELLRAALDAGAFGLSSGLIYPPGAYSDTDELVQLAQVLAPWHVYATHMRDEAGALQTSLEEAITVGERASCRVQVSHLKSGGRANWGKAPVALRRLDRARDAGVRITQDVYPYIAASTTLTACLPPWAHAGGDQALLARLDDPVQRDRMRAAIESTEEDGWENLIQGSGYDGVMVAGTPSGNFEGRTLTELATELHLTPFDVLVTVLRAEQLRVTMVEFAMNEPDIEAIMVNPSTMIASDGLPTGTGGTAHPRLYGTFPRVLGRYVRERGVLGLESAIHKMTGLPAQIFALRTPGIAGGRGVIEVGAVADLVAFSAEQITDVGTYRDPNHPPRGIRWVMQAGSVVVSDGRWQGVRTGSRLRPLTP